MSQQGNSNFNNDMFKMFKDFMEPNMDVDSWVQMYRKNTELLNNAARSTVEVFRNISQLQGQYANQLMQQANVMVQGLTMPGKWEDKLSQTAEMAQQNMQMGMNYGRQMAEKIQDNHNNLIKMFEHQYADQWQESCSSNRRSGAPKK